MTPSIQHGTSDWRRSSPRRRAVAIGLTLAAELAFLLILLGLNPTLPDEALTTPGPVMINLSPEPAAKPAPARRVQTQRVRPLSAKPVPVPLQPKPPVVRSPSVIPVSKAEMAAGDIAQLGTGVAGSGGASDSLAASGPGEGPGGARLYKAEWYREPTQGELAYYLPKIAIAQGSWATIGCQTISAYHVENCILLGESPPGSGLARAMRQAAWQFLVRPPRIDGKPLIGSWVKIRVDFSKSRSD